MDGTALRVPNVLGGVVRGGRARGETVVPPGRKRKIEKIFEQIQAALSEARIKPDEVLAGLPAARKRVYRKLYGTKTKKDGARAMARNSGSSRDRKDR